MRSGSQHFQETFRTRSRNLPPNRFRNASHGTLVDLPGDTLSNIAVFDGTNVLSRSFANQLGHYQGAVLFPRHDNIDDIMRIPDAELEGLRGYVILNFDRAIAARLDEFVKLPSVKNLRIEFHMDRMTKEFGNGTPPSEMIVQDKVTVVMKEMAKVLREAPHLENLALVIRYPPIAWAYDPEQPSAYRWHGFSRALTRINEGKHLKSFTQSYPEPEREREREREPEPTPSGQYQRTRKIRNDTASRCSLM
jgi:hypothetical protein